ncbi:MAG: hypothetical protein JWL86_2826, partial [Rhizobium sp.]|nr:hypothetical protein [Rhizobium sp.]
MVDESDTSRNVLYPAQFAHGIDRSVAVQRVLDLLAAGTRHVHLYGPPGFGKRDAIAALVEACPDRALVVRLHEIELGYESPLKKITDQLSGARHDLAGWPVNDWTAAWARISEAARGLGCARPLLILETSELLFDVHYPEPWPASALESFDLVTVSVAPLHLIYPLVSQGEARKISVPLQAFPAPEMQDYAYEPASHDRWNAQPEADYLKEGTAWFERFMAKADGADHLRPALEHVFSVKHQRRQDDIWEGHPLLNVAALQRMLDTVLVGGAAKETVDRFKADLGSLRGNPSALRDRLLPFLAEAERTVSPKLALSVAEAVAGLALGDRLDARARDWAFCSGLVRPVSNSGECVWTNVASLIAQDPETETGREEIRRWAERLRMAARETMRRVDDWRFQTDRGFQEALDQVRIVFCENDLGYLLDRRIEFNGRTRSIIPGQMYSIALSYFRETSAVGKSGRVKDEPKERAQIHLLIFETGAEGMTFWRHHVRVLSMLGRLRHPALPAFRRGGVLRIEDDPGQPERVYVEIEDVGERLGAGNLHEALQILRTPPRDAQGDALPIPAFEQIVRLAEALDLIHAQGLLHRSLNFDALALAGGSGCTQLVVTGFEYSVNLRSLLRQRYALDAAVWRSAPWNLAGRAPEAATPGDAVIDPSVDVYAFGALAIMLMTGLPADDVLAEVDRLLPVTWQLNGAADAVAESDGWSSAAKILRLELLSPERWGSRDYATESLRNLLNTCLDDNPAKRPVMEDLAPRLRRLLAEYSQSFVRSRDVRRVSFHDYEMGRMLKQLDLIDEDKDIESVEGRAWLRGKIQEWLNECRWMHYSEHGFPKQGDVHADMLRRNSKYVFAGPAVVFFAAPYEPPGTRKPTWDILWLGYAMHRHDINLPDPVDCQVSPYRATTED